MIDREESKMLLTKIDDFIDGKAETIDMTINDFSIIKSCIEFQNNIQWLIDQYQHEAEAIEQDLAEIKRDFYLSGKLAAYNKVIKDLQGVLS